MCLLFDCCCLVYILVWGCLAFVAVLCVGCCLYGWLCFCMWFGLRVAYVTWVCFAVIITVGGSQVVCCVLLGFWLCWLRLFGGWVVGIVAGFMYYYLCDLVCLV